MTGPINEMTVRCADTGIGAKIALAMRDAASIVADVYGLNAANAYTATRRSAGSGLFYRIWRENLWSIASEEFNREYLDLMFSVYARANQVMSKPEYDGLFFCRGDTGLKYTKEVAMAMNAPLGVALLLLHDRGVLRLPLQFSWPSVRGKGSREISFLEFIRSPLIRIIREASHNSGVCHPSFDALLSNVNSRIDFVSRSMRALIALGWLNPEEACAEDLAGFHRELDRIGIPASRFTSNIRQMVALFAAHFSGFKLTVADYDLLNNNPKVRLGRLVGKIEVAFARHEDDAVFKIAPKSARMEVIEYMQSVPGTTIALQPLASDWLVAERAYLKVRSKVVQNLTQDEVALAHLNAYLFFYLPRWLAKNDSLGVAHPRGPNKFLPDMFVSSLKDRDPSLPLGFIEFMERVTEAKELSRESLYINLKSIEAFFKFIEQRSNDLPGCIGFRQPIAAHDFPRIARSHGTNKRPLPRRLLGAYIAYSECLIAYAVVMAERIIDGAFTQDAAELFLLTRGGENAIVDSVLLSHLMGYEPVLCWGGRVLRMKWLPNVFCVNARLMLRDGRRLLIPQPHALIQNLVAIFTGLRHQHIQWLDAESYDKGGGIGGGVSYLVVNTDKVKQSAWRPIVNDRVLELLRIQKAWRDKVSFPNIKDGVYYEGNKNSRWGRIIPLFSLGEDGSPHNDERYAQIWVETLAGFQGLLGELGLVEERDEPLVRLLPKRCSFQVERSELLRKYGSLTAINSFERTRGRAPYVAVQPKSDITPHSARVGLISHLVTLLPADVIGRYVTGQTAGLVSHYVKFGPGDLRELEESQKVALHIAGVNEELGQIMREHSPRLDGYVRADRVNSSLVRSMRTGKINDVIASYGCVSLSFDPDGRCGVDLLQDGCATEIAFNKAEICVYGNRCPSDVVSMLKGFQRCGVCPYAVRSIDHLPAIAAKRNQIMESLEYLELRLSSEDPRYTERERAESALRRQFLAEEALGYKLAEEVLDRLRREIADGKESRVWAVPEPEILKARLQRLEVKVGETDYVMKRLVECVAYPTFDSPEIRGKFDLLRRQVLARSGDARGALFSPTPENAALICIGQMKTLADANGIAYDDIPGLVRDGAAEIEAVADVVPLLAHQWRKL